METGWRKKIDHTFNLEKFRNAGRVLRAARGEIGAIERSFLAQFHQMVDHRQWSGDKFSTSFVLASRSQVYTDLFSFSKEKLAPFKPRSHPSTLRLSLSLFCASGMKNEVDRVRAGILRNRGRDASRNEATTSKPNSNDRAPLFLSPRNRDPPRFPIIDDPAFVGLRPRLETRKIGRRSTND